MGTLMNSLALKVVAAVAAIVLVACGVGVALWANNAANTASLAYKAKRDKLDANLRTASQQGYTTTDLAPITSQENTLDASQRPWFAPGQVPYYDGLTSRTNGLIVQLGGLEQQLLSQARTDTTKQTDAA